MPRTRILFIIGNFGTGGKERQLTEIIKGLSRERYEIHLFAKRNSSFYLGSIEDHLASYYIFRGSKLFYTGCGGGQVDIDLSVNINIAVLDILSIALNKYKKPIL